MDLIISKSRLSFYDNIIKPQDLLKIYKKNYLNNINLKNIQTYQCFRNASIFLISRLYKIIFQIIELLPENIDLSDKKIIDF